MQSKALTDETKKMDGDAEQPPESEETLTVLVLATTFPRSEEDRVPQFIYELSKILVDNRFEVIVLTPHSPGAARREVMSGVTVYRCPYFVPYRLQRLVFQGQGGILPTMRQSILAVLQAPLLFISLLAHSAWILHREEIDVINTHWLIPNGVIGAIVAAIFDVPHALSLHARGVLVTRRIPLGSQIVNFVYDRTDCVLPVSTHIRDTFLSIGSDHVVADGRFQIQPMGADTDEYPVEMKPDLQVERNATEEIRGLFVGRLADKKGVEYLLDAAQEICTVHENFQLIVVGSGPLEETLREQASSLELEDVVTFTGWVSDDELRDQYVLADFVVVPSIETANGDTEGMPTVVAEAFAAGNPVIGTDAGGIPDVVRDGVNGYVVEQRRPDRLAEAMEDLIENPKTRAELSSEALETATELDWEHCGTVYADAFRAVCDCQSDEMSLETLP